MKLVSSNPNPSPARHRLPVGPETCVIDLVQFLEVLRRQMVHGIQAVWQETAAGSLVISFPETDECEMTVHAGQWRRDVSPVPGAPGGGHLRRVH